MPMAVAGVEGVAVDPAAPSPSHAPPSRQDLQAAIAKAVELRQLHAALLQRGTPNARTNVNAGASPTVIRLPPTAASPARSRTAADEGYPVFTPVYDEDERVAGLNHICQDNRSLSENWSSGDAALPGYDPLHAAFPSSTSVSDLLFPSSTDHRLLRNRGAAYKIHPAFLHSAPSADRCFVPSSTAGRTAHTSSDLKLPPATCGNAFRPATIGRVPPPSAAHSGPTKPRGPQQILSWLFPKSSKNKKAKPPPPGTMTSSSPTAIERENVSRLLTEWGALSLHDSLKKEVAEANAHRDAALREAAEVRASVAELAAKLTSLEAYCSELKSALRHTTPTTSTSSPSVSRRSTRSAVEAAGSRSSEVVPATMPVSHDAMVEGFLQVASEGRLSVKQLCKALIHQVDQEESSSNSNGLMLSDKLNLLLRPHHLALPGNGNGKNCSKSSKAVLYHLEAAMNQAMYQDFENRAFQRDGAPRCLDPAADRRRSFDAFVALRNLSWNEVLRKGTKYYSEDFGRFCDRKMSGVVAALGWTRPWPEQLLQCFFVAAKCVWLLHLLAFSFDPPLAILRVEDGRAFDQMYMEDILMQQDRQQSPCQVKVMVMPGFYVQDRVLKCRVLTNRSAG